MYRLIPLNVHFWKKMQLAFQCKWCSVSFTIRKIEINKLMDFKHNKLVKKIIQVMLMF